MFSLNAPCLLLLERLVPKYHAVHRDAAVLAALCVVGARWDPEERPEKILETVVNGSWLDKLNQEILRERQDVVVAVAQGVLRGLLQMGTEMALLVPIPCFQGHLNSHPTLHGYQEDLEDWDFP